MIGHFTRRRDQDDSNRRDLVYDLDAWERYSWRQFLRLIGRDKDASELRQWENRRPEWALLGREIFARLLTKDDLMELDDPKKWAQLVHGQADELPEWRTLTELCAGYRYDAGVAALAIVKQLHDDFDGQLPGNGDQEEDQQQGDGGGGGGGGGGDQQGDQDQDGNGDGNGDGDDQDQQGDGDGQDDAMGEAIRDAMRKACAQAQQNTTERRDAMRALGVAWGNEAGHHGRDSSQQQQATEVAKRLRSDMDFKALANLAGRMRASIKQKRAARLKGKPAELSDVILGNDLARLLPTEMAMLRRRPLRLDLLKRLTERQAAQYEVTGREVAERGPLVVAIDFSGSMSGDNLMWAKAVAMALASVARDQQRPFMAMAFDTRVLARYEDTEGLQSLLKFINRNSAGGTSWDVPLDEAREKIIDPKTKRFEQADIILITDGECGTDERWRKNWERWRMESGVHCYGIHIDDSRSHGWNREATAMAHITDEIFQIRTSRNGEVHRLDSDTDNILQRFAEVL